MHNIDKSDENFDIIQETLNQLNEKLASLLKQKKEYSWNNLDPRVAQIIGTNSKGLEKYKGGFRTLNIDSKKSLDKKYFSEGISFQNLFTHEILKSMGKDETWLFESWDANSSTQVVDNEELILSKLTDILTVVESTDYNVNEVLYRAFPTKRKNVDQTYFLLNNLLDWSSTNLLNTKEIDVYSFFMFWNMNREHINKKTELYKINRFKESQVSDESIKIIYLLLFLALFFHYFTTFCSGYKNLYSNIIKRKTNFSLPVQAIEFIDNEDRDELDSFEKETKDLYSKIVNIISDIFEYYESIKNEELYSELKKYITDFINKNKTITTIPPEIIANRMNMMCCFSIPVSEKNIKDIIKIYVNKEIVNSYEELSENLDNWREHINNEN